MHATTMHIPEMTWQELTAFPGKGEMMILRDEGDGGARTLLVRLHAGGRITPHAHEAPVQHYVLDGEYESNGIIYGAGTYRLLGGHANVDPITTQNGVTILMIYDPVV